MPGNYTGQAASGVDTLVVLDVAVPNTTPAANTAADLAAITAAGVVTSDTVLVTASPAGVALPAGLSFVAARCATNGQITLRVANSTVAGVAIGAGVIARLFIYRNL